MPARILIVQPQKEVSFLLQTELIARGFAVQVATTADVALELASVHRFHLFLIETSLPDTDAAGLCNKIREKSKAPDTPIVFLDSLNLEDGVSAEVVRKSCNINAFYRAPLSIHSFVDGLCGLAGDPGRTVPPEQPTAILEEDSLPKMIRTFYDFRKSGMLTVRNRDAERSIYFLEGMPRFASSSVNTERIGAVMRREGVLTQDEFKRVLEVCESSGRHFGRIAQDLGYVTKRDLTAYLSRHLFFVAEQMFALTDGEMLIGEVPQAFEEVGRRTLHPFHLIRWGIALAYDTKRLARSVSSEKLVPIPLASRTFRLRDIRLMDGELAFLGTIDGTKTIHQLQNASSLSGNETSQLLATLKYARMVRLSKNSEGPVDHLTRQADAYHSDDDFSEFFFRHPWDHTDPGLLGATEGKYRMLDITEPPGGKPWRDLLPASQDPDLKEAVKSYKSVGNKGVLVFAASMVLFIASILLFVFVAGPSKQIKHPQVNDTNSMVIRPTYAKARAHYVEGMRMLETETPEGLQGAVEKFQKALEIDPYYEEAKAALRMAEARFGGSGEKQAGPTPEPLPPDSTENK